jgi:hypothetical protein
MKRTLLAALAVIALSAWATTKNSAYPIRANDAREGRGMPRRRDALRASRVSVAR